MKRNKVGLGILVIILGTVIKFAFFDSAECEKGHLDKIDSCESDVSSGWMDSGEYFLKAVGTIAPAFCNQAKGWPQTVKLHISEDEIPNFKKHPCDKITGDSSQICYTFARPASNYNTSYFNAIVSDPFCKQGIYFSGSKFALLSGKATKVGLNGAPPEYLVEYPEISNP